MSDWQFSRWTESAEPDPTLNSQHGYGQKGDKSSTRVFVRLHVARREAWSNIYRIADRYVYTYTSMCICMCMLDERWTMRKANAAFTYMYMYVYMNLYNEEKEAKYFDERYRWTRIYALSDSGKILARRSMRKYGTFEETEATMGHGHYWKATDASVEKKIDWPFYPKKHHLKFEIHVILIDVFSGYTDKWSNRSKVEYSSIRYKNYYASGDFGLKHSHGTIITTIIT